MATLFSKEQNREVEVPDDQVAGLLRTNRFSFLPGVVQGEFTELVHPSGEIHQVPSNQILEHLDKGFALESEDSKKYNQMREEYTGFLPALKAAGLSVAKGASVNLSTPIAEGLGIDTEAYEHFNPAVSTGSEIAGTVGSLFIPFMAPARLAKGAQAVAKAATKTFGNKTLRKASAAAIEGGLDGAIYGGTQAVAELTQRRSELTGQAAAAHVLKGTAFGGAAGASFGGALYGLGVPVAGAMAKASGPMKKLVGDALPIDLPTNVSTPEEFFTGVAENAAYDALGGRKKFQDLVAKRGPEWEAAAKKWFAGSTVKIDGEDVPLIAAGDTWEDLAGKLESVKNSTGESLGSFYRDLDEQVSLKSGVSHQAIVAKLDKMRDELPELRSGALRRDLDEVIDETMRDAILSDIERRGTGELRNQRLAALGILHDTPFREVRDRLGGLSGNRLREVYDRFGKTFGDDFSKLDFQHAVNNKGIYYAQRRFDMVAETDRRNQFGAIGALWRDEIDDAAARALTEAQGANVAKETIESFKEAKKQYGYASEFLDQAADKASRARANNKSSLTDNLYGATFLGGTLAAAGGAAAGAPGALVAGMVGALGSRYLRERGLSYTVAGARSLAALAKSREATLESIGSVASKLSRGIKEPRGPIGLPFAAKTLSMITFDGNKPEGDTREEVLNSIIGQIGTIQGNPESFGRRLTNELGELNIIAPEVAKEVIASKSRMVNFLWEKAPKPGESYSKLQPKLYAHSYLTPDSMGKFERYLYASMNPIDAVKNDLGDGSLTSETLEAVETIYPALFQELRSKIVEEMAGSDKILSPSEMLQVSKIFKESITRSQSPGFMRRQQKQFRSQPEEQKRGGLSKSSAKVGRMEELMTTGPQAVNLNLNKN
jgi:hypothetical protein